MNDNLEAAKMLKMMAYFDNQSLWYGLFRAGLKAGCPLYEVIKDDASFNGVMATLSEYSFLEFRPHLKEWNMHNCVHDWVSVQLSKAIDTEVYWYAFDCVSAPIRESLQEQLACPIYSRYVPHAKRLSQRRLLRTDIILKITPERLVAAKKISWLLLNHAQYDSAERLLKPLLLQSQTARGPDDKVTLMIMNDLGYLYWEQARFSEAKTLLERALAGKKKTLGPHDSSLFVTKLNLGHLYSSQGDYKAAEQVYLQALFDKDLSAEEYTSTLLNLLRMIESKCCDNYK